MCAADQNTLHTFSLDDNVLKKIWQRIQIKGRVKDSIDPDLFNQTATAINTAVDDAFGGTKMGDPNHIFIEQLKKSNDVFAAFKAHAEQNELAAELVDPDTGNLRSFGDFRKVVQPIIGSYNDTWLQTEYKAAVKSARTAEQFISYEDDEDIYPNLRWVPSRAVNPREAHIPYYNQIRRLHDAWWKTHYPGAVWGCQCDIENTDQPPTHIGDVPVSPLAAIGGTKDNTTSSPGLSINPVESRSIFSSDHPYVTNAYAGAEKAVAKFLKEVDDGNK